METITKHTVEWQICDNMEAVTKHIVECQICNYMEAVTKHTVECQVCDNMEAVTKHIVECQVCDNMETTTKPGVALTRKNCVFDAKKKSRLRKSENAVRLLYAKNSDLTHQNAFSLFVFCTHQRRSVEHLPWV